MESSLIVGIVSLIRRIMVTGDFWSRETSSPTKVENPSFTVQLGLDRIRSFVPFVVSDDPRTVILGPRWNFLTGHRCPLCYECSFSYHLRYLNMRNLCIYRYSSIFTKLSAIVVTSNNPIG